MQQRVKLGLVLLGALAVVCLAVLLFQDAGPRPGAQADLVGDADTSPSAGTGDPPGEEPRGLSDGPRMGHGAPAHSPGSGSLVGARDPSGIDLSSPEVRVAELRRLLGGEEIDWQEAARVVALMQPGEAVPEDLRSIILEELRSGRRLQVMHVFSVLQDASFVEDLFEILGSAETSKAQSRAVLEALWRMPGGSDDEIARRLEGRLTGDIREDVNVLRAIGKRGGPEAARAMVEYLQRAKNPRDVQSHVLQALDVTTDPEAARVIEQALRTATAPKVQRALVDMVARQGASSMTAALVALDREGVADDVRSQTLVALGRIGDAAATEHLLRKAAEPGVFAEQALQSLAVLQTSDAKVGDLLAGALSRADTNPQPERAKASLLQALGTARHVPSLPVVAEALDDAHPGVQEAAITAMGRMGTPARDYVARLTRVYEHGPARMQQKVAVALGDIGGAEAVREMHRMLEEKGINLSVKRTLQMALAHAEGDLKREQR